MKIILFVFICVIHQTTFSQDQGSLYYVYGTKDTALQTGSGTLSPLQIVSINKDEKSQVVTYKFDMRHSLMQQFYKKHISPDSIQQFAKFYLLDTMNLKKWEKENELQLYMQLTKGKWKIIADVNRSGTFTDDPVYFRDTSFFANRNGLFIPVKVKFWHYGEFEKSIEFKVLPDAQLPKKYPEAIFNTWGGARKIMQGKLHIGLDSFLVKLYLNDLHVFYSKYNSNYSVSNVNENDFQLFSTAYPVYSRKDSLYIGNQILILDTVSILGDTIVFRKVGENEAMKGVQPGALLTSVFGKHLITGVYEDIYFKRRDSKYTFLHFWGSWCGPCIANLPKLKTFVSNNTEKLDIISFPFEQQQDTLKTKKLIQQYGLNWKQIIQLRDHPFQKSDIVKQLRIEHFPTYMLIDSSGKILVRTSKLEKITEVLQ
jgi:thiol-disulfide isomerase/thioredoxin